jgi:ferredoxin-NADP reductase
MLTVPQILQAKLKGLLGLLLRKGYVQNHIREFEYMSTPTTFYLCGNGAMIKDTKEVLAADGFDASRVFAEAFD